MLIMECGDTNPLFNRISHLITETSLSIKTSFSHIYIHIGAAALLIARPSLFTGALAYLLFKSFDYSIFRASKEIFYIPLSFDCRYRAKEVIDSFGYRASKGGIGGIFSLATMIFKSIPGAVHASIAMGSAFTWMLTVKNLVHQHDEMLKEPPVNSEEK